jgi:thioesterase DpgC
MTTLTDLLSAAGLPAHDGARLVRPALSSGTLEGDWSEAKAYLAAAAALLRKLPARPRRSAAEQAAAAALLSEGRAVRERFLRRHAPGVYDRLTDGRRRSLRLDDVAQGAAASFPGLAPTPAEVAADREYPQMHQDGVQIDQGILFAHLFADRTCGLHLLHAMTRPTPAALERLASFRATGRVSFPSMTLERQDTLGRITFHHQAWLNAEDEEYQEALEILVDVVLLDDAIRVGVLRGAPMTKAKYAGQRVFGAGINLTHLYHGKIGLVRFMLDRETGPLGKIYRGLSAPEFDPSDVEDRVEKPFIAGVDSFAIGGHCQMLLVLDAVVAQRGAYFNLPARKEGIIPGVANLRLPRFVGERATRQGIFFNRDFTAESAEGRMICDEIVDGEEEMERAIARRAADLTSAGVTSMIANRRALRTGAEPLDDFRRYMAVYSREQAYCLYSEALVDNLVRNWNAHQRSI